MKFVIFDIDGTLADTKKVDDACFIEAFLAVFGVGLSGQDWSEVPHVTDTGIVEHFVQNAAGRLPFPSEMAKMQEVFLSNLARERRRDPGLFAEVPGAAAFFHQLDAHPDVRVGLATGAWEASAKLKLAAIGIDCEAFPFSHSGHFTSREAIVLHTLQLMDQAFPVGKREVIYFGDGLWDLRTCQNLGIRFVGIDIAGDGKLAQNGAQQVFPNFSSPKTIQETLGINPAQSPS